MSVIMKHSNIEHISYHHMTIFDTTERVSAKVRRYQDGRWYFVGDNENAKDISFIRRGLEVELEEAFQEEVRKGKVKGIY